MGIVADVVTVFRNSLLWIDAQQQFKKKGEAAGLKPSSDPEQQQQQQRPSGNRAAGPMPNSEQGPTASKWLGLPVKKASKARAAQTKTEDVAEKVNGGLAFQKPTGENHILGHVPSAILTSRPFEKPKCVKEWVEFLSHLDDDSIQWMFSWFPSESLVFRTRVIPFLILMGLQSLQPYAPLRTLRQSGRKQNIPLVADMDYYRADYKEGKIPFLKEVIRMWKLRETMKADSVEPNRYQAGCEDNYMEWLAADLEESIKPGEVVIHGEGNNSLYPEVSIPPIESVERLDGSVFHIKEIVCAVQAGKIKLPQALMMVAWEMLKNGFRPGQGLGLNSNGIVEPIQLPGHNHTFGLGYEPTPEEIALASLKRRSASPLPKPVPLLNQSFLRDSAAQASEEKLEDDLLENFKNLFIIEGEAECSMDGKVRVCVDYRDLNKASPKDDFPLPNIHMLIDNCAKHELQSFVDCYAGYHQILMNEEDAEKTAFITPWGVYYYRVMPFGLKNAGATYMRAMTTIFHDMIHKEIEVYVDDIIIKSRKSSDHLTDLRKFFDRLRRYNLKLNPAKCAFGVPAGKLLGFIVSRRGIELDPSKIKTIQELPAPKSRKDVMSFLGRLNYISRFIAQSTVICEPIIKLLRKDAPTTWTEDCQRAFDKIKEYLSSPPVLVPPEAGRPLLLYLSVSENAFGCVLGQHDETRKKERAIYYLSKKFTPYEARYTLLERTCCALTWVAQKLRHYLSAYTTYLISRMDPLKYIFQKPMPTGKLAKWQMLLSEFDIVYVTQKAVKGQAIADHLAENPVDKEYIPLKTYFPDEEVLFIGEGIAEEYPGWRLFFDGAANSKGVGIGAVLISESGQHYPISAKIKFPCTNNMAEYEACILGLRMAADMHIQELLVIGDSDLLVHQVRGEWTTKNGKILPYLHCVKDLCKRFIKVEFKHVPRTQNEFADALATLSSMIQHPDKNRIDPIKINVHDQHAHCFYVDEEPDGEPWYYDINKYLKTGDYPEGVTSVQKKTLRRLANHFFLSGEILYRRTPELGLLRCVDAKEAARLIEEVHGGTCGPHMNGFTLAKKILRAGYFWMTMESDCIRFVQKCHRCQIHGDLIRVPPNELNVTSSPWPFASWGMDVIGPIEPAASNGHKFILVAIDYFTKWVEASSHKSVTKKVVADFVRSNIICRFGVPESIITDNGANLNSGLMQEICDTFKITHRNSTPYRPQMNGAVEAANKNIKRILRKMIDNYKHWHEKLPLALLGYRTTVRTSTGATPYLLVYGTEAVLPAEVEIPSLRIIQEAELSDAKWTQNRYEQLMLIDGKRLNAVCHGQLYQNRMARAFNKKVRPRQFKTGQLVLKRIFPCQDEAKGKFAPNWQGPYMVHRVLTGGALILAEMDGEIWPKAINADAVKRYYI
ncbi:uncharacterized protein LOC132609777 [Lycium barbarum]|uniref:uncharacterized protein LOC132609777 n=1 Tax=Lycium barbarum TaxID=112863 RepID=UPI00293F516B|nr:uncharacterized protein LOC132609777 [Lycium barbarum]